MFATWRSQAPNKKIEMLGWNRGGRSHSAGQVTDYAENSLDLLRLQNAM